MPLVLFYSVAVSDGFRRPGRVTYSKPKGLFVMFLLWFGSSSAFQVKKEEEQARLLHGNYGGNSQGSASSTSSSLSPPPPSAAGGNPAAGVAAAAGGGGGGEAGRGSPGPALMPQVGFPSLCLIFVADSVLFY